MDKATVHMEEAGKGGRTYCGRITSTVAADITNWAAVTCMACKQSPRAPHGPVQVLVDGVRALQACHVHLQSAVMYGIGRKAVDNPNCDNCLSLVLARCGDRLLICGDCATAMRAALVAGTAGVPNG